MTEISMMTEEQWQRHIAGLMSAAYWGAISSRHHQKYIGVSYRAPVKDRKVGSSRAEKETPAK